MDNMNIENFETITVETDLLILGGGMAACGAAFEAAYWARKHNMKVTVVDKAAMERSGAVAMGLSAINLYLGLKDGNNTVEDYVNYVKTDLMGIYPHLLILTFMSEAEICGANLYQEMAALLLFQKKKTGYIHPTNVIKWRQQTHCQQQ